MLCPAPSEPTDWAAAWPSAKLPVTPLIVATMLLTVVPPVLVMIPPTYMARGPEPAQLLLSIGIDWTLVAESPVRSWKVSCASAAEAKPNAASTRTRSRTRASCPA